MPNETPSRERGFNDGNTGSHEAPRHDGQDMIDNEAAARPNLDNDPQAGAIYRQSQGDTIEHAATGDMGLPAGDAPTPPGGPASTDTSAPAGARIGAATTPVGAIAGGGPTCPPDFPVKADQGTMRFHVPGRRTYDQVIPTWCFENEAAALNAGYTAEDAGE